MKSFITKFVVLMLAICSVGLLSQPATSAAFPNDGDLIWDANATQGQYILKGKYKESPENGLIDQSLEAELKNVPPGTLIYFSVDGHTVGSAVADAFGTARFSMDILGMPDDGTGRVDGPRAETGSILRAYRGNQGISASFVPRP